MTAEQSTTSQLKVTLFSFGFKHAPPEADMVWDVRFLPNPYWVPELKDHTGQERDVAAYVLKNEAGTKFLQLLEPLLQFLLEQYQATKKDSLTLGIGCTGGRHRSVAVTEHLKKLLCDKPQIQLNTFHRDIEKE